MKELFTFNEAIERGITKVGCKSWAEGTYLEFEPLVGVPTKDDYGKYYNPHGVCFPLPLRGIDLNDRAFTFVDGIETYEEYFAKVEMAKLKNRIKKVKKS